MFPTLRVTNIIKGIIEVKGHGSKDMPVWGDAFKATGEDEAVVEEEIACLAYYLESIQKKEPFEGTDSECAALVDWLLEGQENDTEEEKNARLNDRQAAGAVVKCVMTAMGFQVDRVIEGKSTGYFYSDVNGFNPADITSDYQGSWRRSRRPL